ncbi:hypothetical protein [Streptosporangium sp. NPDC000509]
MSGRDEVRVVSGQAGVRMGGRRGIRIGEGSGRRGGRAARATEEGP